MQSRCIGLRSKYTALFQKHKHEKGFLMHRCVCFVQICAVQMLFYAYIEVSGCFFLSAERLRIVE